MGEYGQMQEVPQFWILPCSPSGELEDPEGYWTKEDRQRRAIIFLEMGWSVAYSVAALQTPQRIKTVLQYWQDRRRDAKRALQKHQHFTGSCPVDCERHAQLLREYDATLAPSDRVEGERKTKEAMPK